MTNLYWLSGGTDGASVPYFPKARGRARVDDRRVLSSIIFIILRVPRKPNLMA
jgi:hypothetical protein